VRPERIRFNFYSAGGVAAICDSDRRLHILGDLLSSFGPLSIHPSVYIDEFVFVFAKYPESQQGGWKVVLTINIHLLNISGDT